MKSDVSKKIYEPLQRIEKIINFYNRTRGVGHTKAMIHGAATSGCVVIGHTREAAKAIVKSYELSNEAESIENIFLLSGPVVIDNGAMLAFLSKISSDLHKALDELNKLNTQE